MGQNLSKTFLLFKKLGIIHDAKKYGNISLWGIIKHILFVVKRGVCFQLAYKPRIMETHFFNHTRASLWRKMGCKVGHNVCIGHTVSTDIGNTRLINIEDNVIITNGCTLLCHRRDISQYKVYDDSSALPYLYLPIHLKTGCQIGMGSIIMPGVTIGEGAIIGAHSVVTKDIPAWTIATGIPCKVVKQIEKRQDE